MSFNKLFDEILDKLPSELDSAWVKFVRSKYKKLWNAAIEECAKTARNHPVFFKSGNMKSADIVRGEIAEAIEKSREV